MYNAWHFFYNALVRVAVYTARPQRPSIPRPLHDVSDTRQPRVEDTSQTVTQCNDALERTFSSPLLLLLSSKYDRRYQGIRVGYIVKCSAECGYRQYDIQEARL